MCGGQYSSISGLHKVAEVEEASQTECHLQAVGTRFWDDAPSCGNEVEAQADPKTSIKRTAQQC